MTTSFEDRLLAELKREVALGHEDRASERPRRVFTPVRVGAVIATAAAACGAAVLLPADGGGASSAYALERTDDGVMVRWLGGPELLDREQAEKFAAELRAAGIHAILDPPADYLCQPYKEGEKPSGEGGQPATDHVGGATTVLDEMIERTDGRPLEDTERDSVPHQDRDAMPRDAIRRHLPDAYKLKKGDTMIWAASKNTTSVVFVSGGCQPVPEAVKPAK